MTSSPKVDEVFSSRPQCRFIERGKVRGEDLYAALGQTEVGRYLIVYFVHLAALAREQGLSTETLVNLWLSQRLYQAA